MHFRERQFLLLPELNGAPLWRHREANSAELLGPQRAEMPPASVKNGILIATELQHTDEIGRSANA